MVANPCPVCRDENILVHEDNLQLLEHFIDPLNKEVYSQEKMQICSKIYRLIRISVERAFNKGQIIRPSPFKEFDYSTIREDIELELKSLQNNEQDRDLS